MNQSIFLIEYLTNHNKNFTKEQLIDSGFTEQNINNLQAIKAKLLSANNLNTQHNSAFEIQRRELATQRDKVMLESGIGTYEVIKDLKTSLKKVLTESAKTQTLAKGMFFSTFVLGFLLILVAVYFGVQGEEFLATAFGVFGMIDIVGLMIANPPLKLQDSRSNYAQLTVGILAWFNDLIDRSSMNQTINQMFVDIFQDRETTIAEKIELAERVINNSLKVLDSQMASTDKILRTIDDVAEPTSKISQLKAINKKQKTLINQVEEKLI